MYTTTELSDGSRICADCGAIFVIDDGKKKYFDDHHLTQPKRCKACRQLRKDIAHQTDVDRAREVLGETTRREDDDFLMMLEG
jgi:hypothetical protein